MFKGFNNIQQNGFVNLNFAGDRSAYGQGGCTMWMRADFGLNTQTNGAAITSWQDYISGVRFIQNTAANQPVLITSNANYNNFPTIHFNNGTDVLSAEGGFAVPNIKTFAFVANYDSLNTRNTVLHDPSSSSSISLGGTAAGINGVTLISIGATSTGTTESNTVKIVVISDNFIMVNGIIESTTTANINFIVNNLGGTGSSSNGLVGKIAEIIGYSTIINQDQALAISNNINQKYVLY